MSLFDQFADEDAFREKFVKPLLNRLGFLRVARLHGSQEFGKDFVFSELDRFGLYRHYAAQVKHEETINQGKKVDDLCSQIEQAFARPFVLSDSPRECHISAVYIFNDGQITANATEYLIAKLRKTTYGDNVCLLDGPRLSDIDKWGAIRQDTNIRERLIGIRNQLHINLAIWESLRQSLQVGSVTTEARGSLLSAIEGYLTLPSLSQFIPYNEVSVLWQEARILDAVARQLLVNPKRESDGTHLAIISSASDRASRIIQIINGLLQNILPITT